MDNRSSEYGTEYRAELEKAREDIKAAFYAGLFCSGMTLIVFLVVIYNPAFAQKIGLDGWIFLDFALISGLTYGVDRKNPLCAKLLLGYFVINKLIQLGSGNFQGGGIFLSVLIVRWLYRGVVGTSTYQRLQSDRPIGVPTISDNSERGEPTRYSPPATAVREKFWVDDRLVELCRGDRAQAEWLLHQLRRKPPEKSMEWYNERAIEEVNTTAVV